MNEKVRDKTSMVTLAIAASLLPILGLTITASENAAAEVEIDNDVEVTNKNNEHINRNDVENSGGNDGFHFNRHCNENTNNDKGEVCHTNEKDR